MSLVAIINKALSAYRLAVFVGGYNFSYARKRGGLLGHTIAKVNEQVAIEFR